LKQEIPFKDYRYVDDVYAGTISPVPLHLTEARYENLESERDAEIHSAIYPPYCDTAQLKQKPAFPSQNHCNYIQNGLTSAEMHSGLAYSSPNTTDQQSFFYPPLATTPAVHATENTARNSLQADYYSRENYQQVQQQSFYHPSSYNSDLIESDPLSFRHRDEVSRSDKEAATVCPIINIQDLTGYTGKLALFCLS